MKEVHGPIPEKEQHLRDGRKNENLKGIDSGPGRERGKSRKRKSQTRQNQILLR